ncbi:MAG: WecB/TagA/CpsF family glycosyltransferase [Verrucomicrobiota bacterium]|nr:WecB/TagA/CpsF family glycosyltransferase [Verrucomicrobiota bacterium]
MNEARVVAADGMAIVWAARFFGVRMSKRCNMTEAFRAFLVNAHMPPSTAILIGCEPSLSAAAAANIHRLSSHCRVVKTFSGFLSDTEYRDICAQHCEVDFVLLGMGTPRTEQVAELAAEICPQAIVWGIGGGTVRIFAGAMREAPRVWRRLGLQWLHRLVCEPGELWRRYLIGNPLFALHILKLAWMARRQKKRISIERKQNF